MNDGNHGELPAGVMDCLTAHCRAGRSKDDCVRDRNRADCILRILREMKIEASVKTIRHGPAVTGFELALPDAASVPRIQALEPSITLCLRVTAVRIALTRPRNSVVIEVPNEISRPVWLRDVLESKEAARCASGLLFGLGEDISGKPVLPDISRMPHLLIGGEDESELRDGVNAIMASILLRNSPEKVRLLVSGTDNPFPSVSHMLSNAGADADTAGPFLSLVVKEMNRRFTKLRNRGVRDIAAFNRAGIPGEEPMPRIVVIVPELAELRGEGPENGLECLGRIVQLLPAVGMHMIVAARSVSPDVFSSLLKTGFPARIAFRVSDGEQSRAILDRTGAEKLIGNRDMLYTAGGPALQRVQGASVSGEEIRAMERFYREKMVGDVPESKSRPADS